MPTITVTGLAALRRKLNSKAKVIINKTIRDKKIRDQIGALIEQDIRKNFNEPASAITKSFRSFLEQFNSTHKDYRRSKINITFTGELLRDLATNVKADTINLAFIAEHSKKKHSTYKSGGAFAKKTVQVTSLKTKKTRNVEQKRSHKQISEDIISRGYEYLKISDAGKKNIVKVMKKAILDNIKKEFETK